MEKSAMFKYMTYVTFSIFWLYHKSVYSINIQLYIK